MSALGEAYVKLRLWRKGGPLPPFEAIEAARLEGGLPVSHLLAARNTDSMAGKTLAERQVIADQQPGPSLKVNAPMMWWGEQSLYMTTSSPLARP